MSCKSCGNSTPLRTERPSVSARASVTKRQVILRPKKKYGVISIPKPANEDKHRM